jgi:hypothetical protein
MVRRLWGAGLIALCRQRPLEPQRIVVFPIDTSGAHDTGFVCKRTHVADFTTPDTGRSGARARGRTRRSDPRRAVCTPTSRSEVMSFRSRVVRNLLEARHVVLGRRPDEVVLEATGSGSGLVKD